MGKFDRYKKKNFDVKGYISLVMSFIFNFIGYNRSFNSSLVDEKIF